MENIKLEKKYRKKIERMDWYDLELWMMDNEAFIKASSQVFQDQVARIADAAEGIAAARRQDARDYHIQEDRISDDPEIH